MKFIVASDIHVHKYRAFNQDNRRLKNSMRLLDELWELAHKHNAALLIAGDLFNNMQLMHTEVIVAVTESFRKNAVKYPKVTCLLISGNHDYATKNFYGRPAVSGVLTLVGLADNIMLIDNSRLRMDGVSVFGLPYYEYREDLDNALDDLASVPKCDTNIDILLMHQTIGFGHDLVPDDIDPEDPRFEAFDMVFNGHIHTYSKINPKFYNVGSPIHRDAGDIGKAKGVLLYDSTTGKVNKIILKGYPEYRKVSESDEIPEIWKDDYVIVVPNPIEVTPEEEEIRENFSPVKKSREELLTSYIDIKFRDTDPEFGKKVFEYMPKLLSHEVEV